MHNFVDREENSRNQEKLIETKRERELRGMINNGKDGGHEAVCNSKTK